MAKLKPNLVTRTKVAKAISDGMLTYGCEVWFRALCNSTVKKKILSAQARWLKAALDLPSNTRNEAIIALTDSVPVDIYIESLGATKRIMKGQHPDIVEYSGVAQSSQLSRPWRVAPWGRCPA